MVPHYRDRLADFRRAALHYMRKGVVKTKRRFGQYSHGEVNSTFWAIAEAVTPHCRPDYEGQEFVLRYDIRNCEARCESVEPDWY